MLNVYSQGPDGAELGLLAARRGEKWGKRYNLGSERGGEHLGYITQPWFQDDLSRSKSLKSPFFPILMLGLNFSKSPHLDA